MRRRDRASHVTRLPERDVVLASWAWAGFLQGEEDEVFEFLNYQDTIDARETISLTDLLKGEESF
jgi:hypothetical protein